MQVAECTMRNPAKALPQMNKVLWECLGNPQMNSTCRSIGQLASGVVARGWLRALQQELPCKCDCFFLQILQHSDFFNSQVVDIEAGHFLT